LDTVYDRLANDQGKRVCEGISDEACRVVPVNFLRTLMASTLTSIGDRLANAKTTLPWLLGYLGAPTWCISLLVPIRESGSMLPQLAIGAVVRRQPIRKWVWSIGCVLQGLSLIGMAGVAATMDGLAAGLGVLGLLIGFSVARGACSLAHKDVLGKMIPKTRRGRLSGWINALAGFSALGVGLGVVGFMNGADAAFYIGLLIAGALLWFGAAAIFATVIEFPGEIETGAGGWKESFGKLDLIRQDIPFRKFVIARALAMGSGLAAPFYVTLARQDLGEAVKFLGLFIAIEGLAALISAPAWGYLADRSSRRVFAAACALASFMSLGVAAWSLLDFSTAAARWFYPMAFFVLGIAHGGVRLGRKTYLIDLADGNKRTDYVAVSNTIIGVLLLASGMISALASVISLEAAIVFLAVAGLVGSALGLKWKGK
jgi:MFS family permease